MENGFDTRELSKFQNDLLNLATKQMPRESEKFMSDEGFKLKKETKKVAKEKVKKITGNYLKSIKKGKTYKYSGTLAIRVYSYAPHAHLIEHGHRQVLNPPKKEGKGVIRGKGKGKQISFVEGKRVFETAKEAFENDFYEDAQKFVDNMLEKGLS